MSWTRRLRQSVFMILVVALAAVFSAETVLGDPIPDRCVVPPELGTTRPDPKGVPTRVEISITPSKIKVINTADETFTVDFFAGVKWKDGRLVDPAYGPSRALCKFKPTEVWTPDLRLLDDARLETRFEEIVVGPKGTVIYRRRFYGTLSAHMDLDSFPFDSQLLPITFASYTYGPEEVEIVFEGVTFISEKRLRPPGWSIVAREGRVSTITIETWQGLRKHIRFDYEFQVQRHRSYYFWKQILPLTLIVGMSWAVFWIPPGQLSAQIGVASTSMLTLIAFLFALSTTLPHVSYLTRMDEFIYGSVILVFLAFVETILTSAMATQGLQEPAKRIDRWARWLFPTAFVGLVAFAFVA